MQVNDGVLLRKAVLKRGLNGGGGSAHRHNTTKWVMVEERQVDDGVLLCKAVLKCGLDRGEEATTDTACGYVFMVTSTAEKAGE
jgi:hypothetical protein